MFDIKVPTGRDKRLRKSDTVVHPDTIPGSTINYQYSSLTKPFISPSNFVVKIENNNLTVNNGGFERIYDFGGDTPFVNPANGKNNPAALQCFDTVLGTDSTAYNGQLEPTIVDWYTTSITNAGVPGKIDKTTYNNEPVTRIGYVSGNGITYGTCRTKLAGPTLPPRTKMRLEIAIAFGKPDGTNDWELTKPTVWVEGPPGTWTVDALCCPVLFFEMKSPSNGQGPFDLSVDTSTEDATKLCITAGMKVNGATSKSEVMRVNGIERHKMNNIIVEMFLDERLPAAGGVGQTKIWINGKLTLDRIGATLVPGSGEHGSVFTTYIWSKTAPCPFTRMTYWKTARILIAPVIQ